MDGDVAALPGLLQLAERFDAWLYLDDAHGFGVLGQRGRGVLHTLPTPGDYPKLVYMATLGKAAGVSGAFVAAQQLVIENLIQSARPYIYTTASPPALAAALCCSLELIQGDEGEQRRARLRHHIATLQQYGATQHAPLLASDTAIQALMCGTAQAALNAAAQLRERGIWITAIRPPTVPKGTSRLRITLSATHTQADLQTLLHALQT